MLKIRNYVRAQSLDEAWQLNQKRTACVLGGMVWLKMGNRNVSTAIDLCGLGLDTIEEREDEFVIGCMTSLHTLETDPAFLAYTGGAAKECLRHIVGVQFRNCATVGGSIFGRYGFSDVLTLFLALDTYVELYKTGRIPLAEFAVQKPDRDILVSVIVKKTPAKVVYLSQRNSETDFPVLTCAASLLDGVPRTVVGARPARAMIAEDPEGILRNFERMTKEEQQDAAGRFAAFAAQAVPVSGNMRGSAEYRQILTEVLTRRAWNALGGEMS